ncbi:MAG: DUF222 domain-containing protein [Acidimicrobiales bacterium]
MEATLRAERAHLDAALARWLLLVGEYDRRQGWERWACRSCAHWLSWQCGVGMHAAREYVRVGRALEGLPLVRSHFERAALSYAKVRAITRVATPETEAALVDTALAMTAAQLERVVRAWRRSEVLESATDEARHAARECRVHWDDDGSLVGEFRLTPEEGALVVAALDVAERDAFEPVPDEAERPTPAQRGADALVRVAEVALAAGKVDSSGADRTTVVVHVDADVLAGGDGAAHVENGPALSTETVRRLACDAGIVVSAEGPDGATLDVGRKSHSIPVAIRRALRRRDGGCRFPGCTARAFVDGHHIKHWAFGGVTALLNLLPLCRSHHRAVHNGGFTIEAVRDGTFRFFRPDGTEIVAAPGAPTGYPDHARRAADDLDLGIDDTTPIPAWRGEHLDVEEAVAVLRQRPGPLDDVPAGTPVHPDGTIRYQPPTLSPTLAARFAEPPVERTPARPSSTFDTTTLRDAMPDWLHELLDSVSVPAGT